MSIAKNQPIEPKKIFYKIFELPTHQVLLTKNLNADLATTPIIVINFFLKNGEVTLKIFFDSEEDRDEGFENITTDEVQQALDKAMKIYQ